MKIRLPEKRYFTLPELAQRWEVGESDVLHSIETSQLLASPKLAAANGRQGVYIGAYGYDPVDEGGLIPEPTAEDRLKWGGYDHHEHFLIMVPFAKGTNDAENSRLAEAAIDSYKAENGSYLETVVLLGEVLCFEAKLAEQERTNKPAPNFRHDSVIGVVATLVAAWPGGKEKFPAVRDLEQRASLEGIDVKKDTINKVLNEARKMGKDL